MFLSPAPHADAPNVTEQAIDSRPLLALVLLAAVMLVYLPGLEGGFTFDDYPTIVDNPALDLSPLGAARRRFLRRGHWPLGPSAGDAEFRRPTHPRRP